MIEDFCNFFFFVTHSSEIKSFLKHNILLENNKGHTGLAEWNELLLEVPSLTSVQI